MKTLKIYAALACSLVFATITSSYGSATGKITGESVVNKTVHHQVNVNLSLERQLCNTYLVEIRDGMGLLVAMPQLFVPGVSRYDFYERGPSSGIRVASLVRSEYGDRYICEYELFTVPAVVSGPFLIGHTYRFDLFPSLLPSKE